LLELKEEEENVKYNLKTLTDMRIAVDDALHGMSKNKVGYKTLLKYKARIDKAFENTDDK
jgi:hypothetical protein